MVLREQGTESVKWKDVLVGDVLMLGEGEYFPCDMLLLSSSSSVYVETKNLDGESNLKTKFICELNN
jgi:P-type E1-E2 ATPase